MINPVQGLSITSDAGLLFLFRNAQTAVHVRVTSLVKEPDSRSGPGITFSGLENSRRCDSLHPTTQVIENTKDIQSLGQAMCGGLRAARADDRQIVLRITLPSDVRGMDPTMRTDRIASKGRTRRP